MPTRHRITPITFGILSLLVLFERPALAYIDPGSGSLIYQAILAAVLGIGFTFRRVLGALTRIGRRPDASVRPPTEEPRVEPRDRRV